jgi:hypothetical protein
MNVTHFKICKRVQLHFIPLKNVTNKGAFTLANIT